MMFDGQSIRPSRKQPSTGPYIIHRTSALIHFSAMSTATDSRTTRKTQIGFVASRSGDKSIKVTIAYKTPHPLYQKVVNRQTVLHVHDEKNETKVGDQVEVMESRPISRLKRWRIVSIIHKAVTTDAVAI